MTPARPDLLALGDESLAALANRGIVKRAVREVGAGAGPLVEVAADGTVTARFGDGNGGTDAAATVAIVEPGQALQDGTCTCAASGVCRHLVMLVVALRAAASGMVPAVDRAPEDGRPEDQARAPWSPGSITDDELDAHVGSRAMALARKSRRAGYRATVRRPGAGGPVTTVELASCTVRFLVPGHLGYARVDAVHGTRDDAVALAVWACREADARDPEVSEVDVVVGGATEAGADGRLAVSGVEPALPLLADLLEDGIAHADPRLATAVAQVRRALDRGNVRWPIDGLDELADQIEAHRSRRARYHPEEAARLVAELVARHRCAASGGATARTDVLGSEEAAETPLRLLRLSGLGARVRPDGLDRVVEVYLAHAEAGLVLALRRRVEGPGPDDGELVEGPTGEEIARRTAGGARLGALAAGNVVTESAVRSASRVVRLAGQRIARTTVAPSTGDWENLPVGVLVDDLDAEAARLAGLAPGLVRSRVVAASLRAVVVSEVEDLAYLPGGQRLVAHLRAPTGRGLLLVTHTAATPGAIDAVAGALDGSRGPVRFVAGHLRREGGAVAIEPTAVVVGDRVVVPAFAPVTGMVLASGGAEAGGPLPVALAEARAVSADVVHRGRRHLPPGWGDRVERAARGLREVGLVEAAASLVSLRSAVSARAEQVLDAWSDTHIRLLVTGEQA